MCGPLKCEAVLAAKMCHNLSKSFLNIVNKGKNKCKKSSIVFFKFADDLPNISNCGPSIAKKSELG